MGLIYHNNKNERKGTDRKNLSNPKLLAADGEEHVRSDKLAD